MASLLSLAAVGCGYTFQGGGSVLPPDVKQVYIPMVDNNSTEPGLSTIVTEALRERFERYGVVRVVDTLQEADAVLRARIVSVNRETNTVTSRTDTALQLDLVLAVAGELRRVTGPILWRNNDVRAAQSFGTASDVVVTSSADFTAGSLGAGDLGDLSTREISRGQEQEALVDLAETVARNIYNQAVTPEF